MKYRLLFAAFAAALIASNAVDAQMPARQGKLPRVAIFFTSPPKSLIEYEKTFVGAMRDLGWIEGSTVVYDRAYAATELRQHDERRAHAAALVARKPDVIWLLSTVNARAVHEETRTIPIVGAAVSDVVKNKLAKSLARPGSNFTGVTNIGWELGAKRLELLNELMPNLTRVGVLIVRDSVRDDGGEPASNNSKQELALIEKTAKPRRIAVFAAEMKDPKDKDEAVTAAEAALTQLAKQQVQAVLIPHLPMFQRYRKAILEAAEKRGIPAVGHRAYFADEGALFAYSSVLDEQLKRSAVLVDKILRGTNPAEIPIEQPTRYELVLNLKTAKALGVTVPPEFLVQVTREVR
jgi:putative ABC transport system substrate-binding protein